MDLERPVVLYIAVSIDGYIADERGGIPLFRGGRPRVSLRLIDSRQYGDLVQLHYAT